MLTQYRQTLVDIVLSLGKEPMARMLEAGMKVGANEKHHDTHWL